MNIFGFILSTSSEDDYQRFLIFKQFDPVTNAVDPVNYFLQHITTCPTHTLSNNLQYQA
jgi:hypothetical protein